jgi:hypothetical protein
MFSSNPRKSTASDLPKEAHQQAQNANDWLYTNVDFSQPALQIFLSWDH